MKALFLKLIMQIYIDKAPRKEKKFPILVRKLVRKEKYKERDIEANPRNFKNVNEDTENHDENVYIDKNNSDSSEKENQDTERNFLKEESNSNQFNINTEKRSHFTLKDKELKSEKHIFDELKLKLIEGIQKIASKLKGEVKGLVYMKVFSEYTYEQLLCIEKLMKFGFYNIEGSISSEHI